MARKVASWQNKVTKQQSRVATAQQDLAKAMVDLQEAEERMEEVQGRLAKEQQAHRDLARQVLPASSAFDLGAFLTTGASIPAEYAPQLRQMHELYNQIQKGLMAGSAGSAADSGGHCCSRWPKGIR